MDTLGFDPRERRPARLSSAIKIYKVEIYMNFRTYNHYLNRISKLMSKGDTNKRLVNKAKRRLNQMGEK